MYRLIKSSYNYILTHVSHPSLASENLALSQGTNKQADHNNSLIQNITSANFSDDVTTLPSLSPIQESNILSHSMSELWRCGSLLIHKSFIKWFQSKEVARCKSDIDFKYKGR